MFNKILIANRGEIANRIIRTCRKWAIQTIAIYSEADANSPHVTLADEAFLVGGPRVKDSYLNGAKIIDIAKRSGAEAIHPGYGLLSENAMFASQCEKAGITFIGPSSQVMEQMASKIEARKAMEKVSIPVVAGTTYPLENVEAAIDAANEIGFPIMLKASAGGGGIGVQIIHNQVELQKLFAGNQKRAIDFFGNGAMYIEKWLENPRHIEIQILADSYGNTVYLWERECSIQRRHQKVIEEAPSPFIDEEIRQRMGEVAMKAAKSIGYSNAGTIEFLVDEQKNFYFLEMNTRLQVEHPVTEEITGLDLVEQQIRISFGEKLSFSQQDIPLDGHAIEVRIYAEDPLTFYPSPGTITKLSIPQGPNIRHELCIHEQSVVTPFYDPMIAKLIIKGKNRLEAVNHLRMALDRYEIEGIKTNLPLLKKIAAHPAFLKGDTTTHFIATILQGKNERMKE